MAPAVKVRPRQTGDLSWACQRQAALYAAEHGYLPAFEEYVLRSVAPFLEGFDPARDGFWVAEQGGHRVGCVAIQHEPPPPSGTPGSAGWAKLRWYFVEREARGQGVGGALLRHALDFASQAGYEGVLLWTVDDLAAARRQYEKAGFRLAYTDPSPCVWAPWGHEQRWELRLR